MKKIIFTHDFLYHSFNNPPSYHVWLFNLLKPIIKNAVECEFQEFKSLNNGISTFSRDKFFSLSAIENPAFSYFCCDLAKISQESIDYLKEFIPKDSLIFGEELSENLRRILDKIECKYINTAFHSFKLFDDLPLLFNTNDEAIFDALNKYKIPQEKFEFYANYWKTFLTENNFIDAKIPKNSALFVGQTMRDLSVEKNGRYLSILDYEDYLSNLCKEYEKVYYLPHPRLEKKRFFKKFLKGFKNVEILENSNVYTLLSNPNITKVVGISSSVLYESRFFDKEVEYLLHPLYRIDEPFGLTSYISIYDEFYKPSFWKELLKNDFQIKKIVCDENFFAFSKNKLRNIRDLYWAYGDLDDGQKMKRYIKAKIKKRISFLALESNEKHFIFYFLGFQIKIRKNKELYSGERQTAPDFPGIRKDHLGRYLLAKNFIKNGDTILDCACGVGYGSFLLSQGKYVQVTGLDISRSAIDFANKNYKSQNINYICEDVKNLSNLNSSFNKIVSFETIEHVKKDNDLLKSFYELLKEDGLLILSAPNETLTPFNKKEFPFHLRHYTPEKLVKMLNENGFEVVMTYSQQSSSEEKIIPGFDGIFNIFVCEKKS